MPDALGTNDLAPDFELIADDGSTVRLRDLRGSKVVLFFYPRAGTAGCTTQACEFRDRCEDFQTGGAVVLGVSPDRIGAVRNFREKHGLTFRLLADEDHRVAELYGVWKEKSMYGKKYWGVERTTYVLDEEGRVSHIFQRVKPKGHAAEVLATL